ncbi:MAG: Fic family protein [Alphaproteobacteria bacterium]
MGALRRQGRGHAGEINALHPFRDGNGRTLRLFLKLWAQRNGYVLAIRRIAVWFEASVARFERQDYRGLQDIIAGALRELC